MLSGLRRRPWLAVLALLPVLVGLYLLRPDGDRGRSPSGGSGAYRYPIGSPGVGEEAPPLRLPSTIGIYDRQAFEGKEAVLLLFQEGVGCAVCWRQLRALAGHSGFGRLPIGSVVSVTTDPLPALRRASREERISFPVLSDTALRASRAYGTLPYSRRPGRRNGNTLILVGRDGGILWCADYGGAPRHNLAVPAEVITSEIGEAVARGG